MSAGNIKESICVIRHDDNTRDSLYNELGNILLKNGYISASRMLKNNDKSFGSGFIFETASGKKYIITNNHVVGTAKYVKIEVHSVSGILSFPQCPILTSSQHYDLALIALPTDLTVDALKAYPSSIKDGQVVYTAGYPAIGEVPVWQFGKGIISNNNVNTSVFGDKDSLNVIQHTAQVDAGNSGGPLLVESVSKEDTTFYVIGTNTWKASRRENTNFSINIKDLDIFITQFENGNSTLYDDIDKEANDFATDLVNGYTESYRYISENMILNINEKTFKSLINQADIKISNTIRSNPIEGLRMLIAEALGYYFPDKKILLTSAIKTSNTKATTIYNNGKKNIYLEWELTRNGWQITNFYDSLKSQFNKTKSKPSYSLSSTRTNGIYKPLWDCIIEVGVNRVKADSLQSYGIGIDYMLTFSHYGLFSTSFNIDRGKDFNDEKWMPSFGFHIGIGAQLPIRFNHFVFSPYILIEPGYNIDTNPTFLIAGKCGTRFGYEFNNETMLFIAPEYLHKFRIFSKDSSVDTPYYIGAKIGFAW